ncbi:MAG: type III-A CRISPR-associated protein Csm2 [Chloroflexi bacterium]|nr:type III-A CRISPR-associated protein Csm2 [Chloroflexota bacterium]
MQNGYFDGKGNVLTQVIIDWPRDIADKLARAGMKTAQFNRFFEEARRIERKRDKGGDFDKLKPELLKLFPFSDEAVKKGNAPPLFREFIGENLKWASRDAHAFKAGFMNHFECIALFYPRVR